MQTLGPYINLIELMVMTVEKIQTQQGTQRRLAELQTMWNISQTISGETDLGTLFRVIHEQVEFVMGEINSFAIALYDAELDSIQIPYMVEAGRKVEVAPFPLGEGLTSIVIRTRRPLLLVADTEAKARALGARVAGVPARSWLGVPLLFGGEVIGAIIAQDIDHDYRFNEEDEHLLSTLAAQVAVVVRNAWLLETTRLRAEQERLLNDITAKIRRSVDIQTILKTTADELGAALGARRAHIEITRPGLLEPAAIDSSTNDLPDSIDESEEVAG
jgi:GAF domain-containing protein